MGIRLAVIDDNPHVSWDGRTYPVNATFDRFLAGFLDLPDAPVAEIAQCVPLRPASGQPQTLPVDPRVRIVGTAPFDGIAGYMRHAPVLIRRNAAILRPVIRSADLLWLKVPASNAILAASLAMVARVPRSGYVAGQARAVAASQGRSVVGGFGARLVGAAYDAAGWLASAGGERIVVGEDLAGNGVVTSLVEPEEIRADRSTEPWPQSDGRLRLAWAGRLAAGKGIEVLIDAVAALSAEPPDGRRVELIVLGDGPARDQLTERAARAGIAGLVTWTGYVADRSTYLAALASADLFVFPSPAEGFPKVVLDAFAAGTPVLARPTGMLAELLPGGLIGPLAPDGVRLPDGVMLAASIQDLAADPERARGLRGAGAAFVASHTRQAEATRLTALWRERWPGLPWD